jgi:uncharacterized protein DUF4082
VPLTRVSVGWDASVRERKMRKTLLLAAAALTAMVLAIPTAAGATGSADGLWGPTGDVPPCIADGSGPCGVNDSNSVELGVRFQTSSPIYLVGVRFYRADDATLSGSLWNTNGQWITSASDTTSGTGWQDAMFSSPQFMVPGDTFTASYFAPSGAYAFQWDYFTPPGGPGGGGYTAGPVTALGGIGANGTFVYGPGGIFPTTTSRDTNYWVTPLWVEDTTAPEITITTPGDGARYLLNQQVAADYQCTDDYDQSPSCSGPVADGANIDTASVGSKTFTVTSGDVSGNPGSLTHTYSVAYGFEGFFSPVDNDILNVAKAGSTIPLKFRVVDANGAPITDLAGATVNATSLACDLGTTTDQIEEYATGGSGLQNLGDGYYQFNWKTPKAYARSCKTVTIMLGDGGSHSAEFSFTK